MAQSIIVSMQVQSNITQTVMLDFADNHTINYSFCPNIQNSEEHAINKLERNWNDIQYWMNQNRLKMNPTKTELIYFGSNKMLGKCHLNSISVSQDIVYSSENIRYLGAWLDNNLIFKLHILKKCSTAMWNIHKICQIREFIDADTYNILCYALVLSHLDYSNGILINTVLNKLQRIQNIAARLLLKKGNYDSASNCLRELHWLPIRS